MTVSVVVPAPPITRKFSESTSRISSRAMPAPDKTVMVPANDEIGLANVLATFIKKFVVFHTPPDWPPAKTVLPLESARSAATAVMVPALNWLLLAAGPVAVQKVWPTL